MKVDEEKDRRARRKEERVLLWRSLVRVREYCMLSCVCAWIDSPAYSARRERFGRGSRVRRSRPSNACVFIRNRDVQTFKIDAGLAGRRYSALQAVIVFEELWSFKLDQLITGRSFAARMRPVSRHANTEVTLMSRLVAMACT